MGLDTKEGGMLLWNVSFGHFINSEAGAIGRRHREVPEHKHQHSPGISCVGGCGGKGVVVFVVEKFLFGNFRNYSSIGNFKMLF